MTLSSFPKMNSDNEDNLFQEEDLNSSNSHFNQTTGNPTTKNNSPFFSNSA